MAKIGRPPVAKKHALSAYFAVRMKPGEAREVQTAIEKAGGNKSEWLRSALLKAARTP